uniref:RagB/SusD family nutrient uptake outer membrane protein n=1 Tax=Prevotella sp. TaxID=59823 RepID=UPI004026CE3A
MKKIKYYIGAAALLLGGLSSCTLDTVNYTEKDQTNFPQTTNDQAQALAAIYQNLNVVNANPQMSWLYVAQLASDDALGGGGENDILMQAEDLLSVSTTNMTEQFWKDRYQGIMRANTLLDAMGENGDPQTRGEALFLRAYYYYELSSMYGNIPLTTTSQKVEPVQATAAQIWGQILQDLYTAATTMPATRRTDGHVDKYCAEGMLGRCWLYYTGMYCNGEDLAGLTSTSYSPLTEVELPDGTKLTKQMVIDCINDCVNNSGYSLVGDFRNLWAYTNRCTVKDYPYTSGAKDKDGNALKWVEDDENGNANPSQTERMFSIKFNKQASWSTTIGYANGYALHFGVRGTACFPFGAGWGAGPVAPNLVSDWKSAEPTDMRMNATIQNMQDLQGFVLGGGGDFLQESGYYDKKLSPVEAKKDDGTVSVCFENLMYPDNWSVAGAENLQLNNIHDLVLMRFAEVLLMQSELTENADGMNKVRARAGLPAVSYSLQALQNERRFELAFEGLRWNDIRRWHIAAAALDKQTGTKIYNKGIETTNTRSGFSYSARYNATAGFQKKPENQVSLSEGGIQQNPGWDDASSMYTKW